MTFHFFILGYCISQAVMYKTLFYALLNFYFHLKTKHHGTTTYEGSWPAVSSKFIFRDLGSAVLDIRACLAIRLVPSTQYLVLQGCLIFVLSNRMDNT